MLKLLIFKWIIENTFDKKSCKLFLFPMAYSKYFLRNQHHPDKNWYLRFWGLSLRVTSAQKGLHGSVSKFMLGAILNFCIKNFKMWKSEFYATQSTDVVLVTLSLITMGL